MGLFSKIWLSKEDSKQEDELIVEYDEHETPVGFIDENGNLVEFDDASKYGLKNESKKQKYP